MTSITRHCRRCARRCRNWVAHPPAPGPASVIVEKGALRFAPLVTQRLNLYAELSVRLFRQQPRGTLITGGGDIDNRLKTLLDGLRVPLGSLEGCTELPPQPDPSPLSGLLEHDSLVTKVAVESQQRLRPAAPDEVVAIISVHVTKTVLTAANRSLWAPRPPRCPRPSSPKAASRAASGASPSCTRATMRRRAASAWTSRPRWRASWPGSAWRTGPGATGCGWPRRAIASKARSRSTGRTPTALARTCAGSSSTTRRAARARGARCWRWPCRRLRPPPRVPVDVRGPARRASPVRDARLRVGASAARRPLGARRAGAALRARAAVTAPQGP